MVDVPRNWEWSSISNNGQYMMVSSIGDGLYISKNNGISWHIVSNIPTNITDLGFVHVTKDGSTMFAGYNGGQLYKSNDSGDTFVIDNNIRTGNWYGISESIDVDVLVLYDNPGTLFISTNTGTTWRETLTDIQRKWVSVSLSNDGSVISAAAQDDNVFLSTDYGNTWISVFDDIPTPWTFTFTTSDGMQTIAGGRNIPIHVTKDHGISFITVSGKNIIAETASISPKGTVYIPEKNGSVYKYYYKPASDLVISSGISSTKAGLKDFVILTDKQKVGIGYSQADAGIISSTLDVNGSLYVNDDVEFGKPLSVASGGTGGNLLNLGLVIAHGKDAFTSTGSMSSGSIAIGSSNGTGIPVIESGDTMRTHLGLGIGTHVQAWNTNLDDISGLSPIDGYFLMGNGTQYVMNTAQDAVQSLGLGNLAFLNTINNSNWSGTALSVANGGTGSTTFTNGNILYYDGTKISNSVMKYDNSSGSLTINSTTGVNGSGLSVKGKDFSLVRGDDSTYPSLMFHESDGMVNWRIRNTSTSSLVLTGGVSNVDKNALANVLSIASSGIVTIHSTTESTAVGIGSVIISGGLSIAKNINTSGKIIITNTEDASNTGPAGSLLVSGGIFVQKSIITSNLSTFGSVTFSGTTDATSSTVASVTTAGGLGVVGKIYNSGGIILERNTVTTGRASGLTIGVDASAWTANTVVSNSNRSILLVNNISGGTNILGFRNSSSTNGWDIIQEGTGTDRLIFQSNISTTSATSWMTLSSTTGTLTINSTADGTSDIGASFYTAGGIAAAKIIQALSIRSVSSVDGDVTSIIQNSNSGSSAFASLRIMNNTSLAFFCLNSSTRNSDGGANTLTIRNDAGNTRLQAKGALGLVLTSLTGAATFDNSITVLSTTDATSVNNGGSATISGGLAVAKSAYIGTNLTVGGTISVTGAVSTPTITTSAGDTVNITTLTVKSSKLVIVNNQQMLSVNFKVTPTTGSINTQFTFILPNRVTNFIEHMDIDSGQCSGYVDDVNMIVLQNVLCTGVPSSTKAIVKFQSVNTTVHNLQVFVTYDGV